MCCFFRFFKGLQQEFSLSLLQQSHSNGVASAEEFRPFVPYLLTAAGGGDGGGAEAMDVEVASAALGLVVSLLKGGADTRKLFLESKEAQDSMVELACSNLKRFNRSQASVLHTITAP